MRSAVARLLQVYRRLLSPILHAWAGPAFGCRFEPSCSQYALEAVNRHGTKKGFFLALMRVCKCNPWGPSGYDPVPR